MEKFAWHGARRMFVPTNPDLADILGRMNFDFDNFTLQRDKKIYIEIIGFGPPNLEQVGK